MTTARAWVALLAAMLVASLGLLWPHADVGEASSCTRATVAGAYGLTATGVLIAPTGSRVQIAFVGRAVYDGQGGLAGTQISSVEGSVEREALAGTYDVRPDCTGAETFTFYPSGETVHADFVVVAQGKQILFVDTDSGVVLSVTATRQ